MQGGAADFSPDQIRTGDIEKQDADGMLVTSDLGFHMGFIAYNIRPTDIINSYWRNETGHRSPVSYWPLHDMEFRHALITCYDQLGIIPPIYGYIVTPVRSLVPPAQSKYYNPGVPEHPYNPGDPLTSPAGEHSSVGILKAAGYTFVDAGTTGVVDDADYWKCPDGSAMPYMEIWTPLIGVAPTSYQHGAEFVNDLRAIGLAATTANGNAGFINLGRDFNEYLEDVYDRAWFDSYMVFYSLGRIPSQLYTLLHSSQDCLTYPGRRNAVGVHSATVDALCDTVKFSLDTDAIETAAKTLQTLLYDTTAGDDNVTLSYMLLYSRSYFNVFGSDVTGAVKSPGYGSDNSWTFFNIMTTRTEDVDGDTVDDSLLIYINGDAPDSFNPCYATTVYEWNIIGQTQDGLTAVNPYNHYDIPWLADDWTITPTVAGMDIDFTLRENSTWQDGHDFVAGDVEFCLEFLRDYHVPRYAEMWEQLIDVDVTDDLTLTIEADEAGIDLFYDFSGLGPMLPPQVWNRTWASEQAVLDYDPTVSYSVASGYTSGPHPPPTNLFGTGPFIFLHYDATNEYDDMMANRNYFMTYEEIVARKTRMFWQVGDQSRDGVVNVLDLTFVSFAYGCIVGDPCYDVDADFNEDGIVDLRDIYISAYHLLWQKEWP
jgi:ABC-type transport system substrate-binding protein